MSEWKRFVANRRALAGAIVLTLLSAAALLAPVLGLYDPDAQRAGGRLEPPSLRHPMGTDSFGRDVMSRALWGGRISQPIGLLSMAVSVIVGVVVGALAGFYGGRADGALMRLTEVVITFPTFFLLLTLVAVFGASLLLLILAIGLTSWPITARIVRAEFLALREREFVTAAAAMGAGGLRLIARHILPNVVPVIVVAATLRVAYVILVEAGLSYLGVGVPPPAPSWGQMLSDGVNSGLYRVVPALAIVPGVALVLTMLAFNLLGDGLRDAIDPKELR